MKKSFFLVVFFFFIINTIYSKTFWVGEVATGVAGPSSTVLSNYDIVIWLTGMDYTSTLLSADETNLMTYLDNGGRLFFASQDYLYDRGLTTFASSYLYVSSYTSDIGATYVYNNDGTVGSAPPSGDPVEMSYPTGFVDYSDKVVRASGGDYLGAQELWYFKETFATDDPIAITYGNLTFRTVFFAFPFEGLPPDSATITMGQIIDWLSAGANFQELLVVDDDNGQQYEANYLTALENNGWQRAYHHIVLDSYPTTIIAGESFAIRIIMLDAFYDTDVAFNNNVSVWIETGPGSIKPGAVSSLEFESGVAYCDFICTKVGMIYIAVAEQGGFPPTVYTTAITVNPAAASYYTVTLDTTLATAGVAFGETVAVYDRFDNLVTNYTGTVTFSSSDTNSPVLPSDYTFALADAGVKYFANSTTLKTAGLQYIYVTQVDSTAVAGTASIQVNNNSASYLEVLADTIQAVGIEFPVTVTVYDAYNNIVDDGFLDTVTFSSTDVSATLPLDYQFTAADSGSRTFYTTFNSSGTFTITATDALDNTIAGTSVPIFAESVDVTHFSVAVSGGTQVTAGVSFTITVTALDDNNYTVTGYTGTIHFSSNDTQAALPADYTFDLVDEGQKSFSVALKTAGERWIKVNDVTYLTVMGTSPIMTVTNAAASYLEAECDTLQISGQAFSIKVTAYDAYDNVVADGSFLDQVHFTSTDTDPNTLLPADYTFTAQDAGVHTFANEVVLYQAKHTTITVTDLNNTSLNDTTDTILVKPAYFVVTTSDTRVYAGDTISFTVTAYNAADSIATHYDGIVNFSSSDVSAWYPDTYQFTSVDGGTHTFVQKLTFYSNGTQTLTATDDEVTSVTGTSARVEVIIRNYFLTSTPPSAETMSNYDIVVWTNGRDWDATLTATDESNISTYLDGGGKFFFASQDYLWDVYGSSANPGAGDFAYDYLGVDNATSDVGASSITGVTGDPITDGWGTTTQSYPFTDYTDDLGTLTATASVIFNNENGDNVAIRNDAGQGWRTVFMATPFEAVDPADSRTLLIAKIIDYLDSSATSLLFVDDDGGYSDEVYIKDALEANGWRLSSFYFKVVAETYARAGEDFACTITVYDVNDNVKTNYTGSVTLSTTGTGEISPSYLSNTYFTNGVANVNLSYTKAETMQIIVTEYGSSENGISNNVVVHHADLAYFKLSTDVSTVIAGDTFLAKATAYDTFGNIAADSTPTVRFELSPDDGGVAFPDTYTFTLADAGYHEFTCTGLLVGTYDITLRDVNNDTIYGTKTAFVVNPGLPAKFLITVDTAQVAAKAFSLTVTAVDTNNNTVTSFRDTVVFESTDLLGTVPDTYTFTETDAGMHTFSLLTTFKSWGPQTITVKIPDTPTINGVSDTIFVYPYSFSVTSPASGVAGESVYISVQPKNYAGVVMTDYGGTVAFSGSSGNVILPDTYNYSPSEGGTHTFVISDTVAENITVTVVDVDYTSAKGTSNNIEITASDVSHFIVSAPTNAQVNVSFTLNVIAKDVYENTVKTYSTAANILLDSGTGNLTGDTQVVNFLNGEGSASAQYDLAETILVRVEKSDDTTVYGISNAIVVEPQPNRQFNLSVTPASISAGGSFDLTVDVWLTDVNTRDTTYTGTVYLVCTGDSVYNLPDSYTFDLADGGIKLFSGITIEKTGTRYLNVFDNSAGQSGSAVSTTTYLRDWLLLGAFSNDDQATRLSEEYIAGEGVIFPSAGDVSGGQTWSEYSSTTDNIDLSSIYATSNAAAYAVLYVYTPYDTTVYLGLGTEYGYKLWLNGKLVASSDVTRAFAYDQDSIKLDLPAGWSALMLKVVGGLTWQFAARFYDDEALTTPAGGLYYRLLNPMIKGGALTDITVNPASVTRIDLTGPAYSVDSGEPFDVTVTVYDQYDNVATNFTGTVTFSTTDAAGTVPADYTFVSGDAGSHTFDQGVTLMNLDTQAVSVSYGTLSDTITYVVAASPTTHLDVVAGDTVDANVSETVVVTAKNAAGETVTTYTGSVEFGTSNTNDEVPGAYTFQEADNGSTTTYFVFKGSGYDTITVDDVLGGGDNIAEYRPVSTYTYQTGYTSDKITDNNTTTGWRGYNGVSSQVIIDLGTTYDVFKIKIYWGTVYASGYSVYISDDQVTWTSVYSTSTGDGGLDNFTFTHQTGRYLKFTFSALVDGDHPEINEIMVYRYISGQKIVIVSDTQPPTVVSATAVNANTVNVEFDEYVTAATAEDSTNYTILNTLGDTLVVTDALLLSDNVTVQISTATQTGGETYTVTVTNVTDISGNPIQAGVGDTAIFIGSDAPDTLPPVPVSATAVDNLTVTLKFNEIVETGATIPTNYEIYEQATPSRYLAVKTVQLNADSSSVTIKTAPQDLNLTYVIRVANVSDSVGNFIVSGTNDTTTFTSSGIIYDNTNVYVGIKQINQMDSASAANWSLYPIESPDGLKIAYLSDVEGTPAIYVQDSTDTIGTTKTRITGLDWDIKHWSKLTWSPDSLKVMFTCYDANSGKYLLHTANADGTSQSPELTNPTPTSLTWFDPDWKTVGTEEWVFASASYILSAFQPNASSTSKNLKSIANLTADTYYIVQPTYSSNVDKIVCVALDAADKTHAKLLIVSGITDILNGTEASITSITDTRLTWLTTNTSGGFWGPQWSTDGTQVAYVTDMNGNFNSSNFLADVNSSLSTSNFDAYIKDASGNYQPQVISNNTYNEMFLAWNANATKLYSSTGRQGGQTNTVEQWLLETITYISTYGGVAHNFGYTQVYVPSNSLAIDARYGISAPSSPPTDTSDVLISVGTAREFYPDGANFSDSVELTLFYTADELSAVGITDGSADEKRLRVYYWDENNSEWVEYAGVVDVANNQIKIWTTHFSIYAVGVPTSFYLQAENSYEPENGVTDIIKVPIVLKSFAGNPIPIDKKLAFYVSLSDSDAVLVDSTGAVIGSGSKEVFYLDVGETVVYVYVRDTYTEIVQITPKLVVPDPDIVEVPGYLHFTDPIIAEFKIHVPELVALGDTFYIRVTGFDKDGDTVYSGTGFGTENSDELQISADAGKLAWDTLAPFTGDDTFTLLIEPFDTKPLKDHKLSITIDLPGRFGLSICTGSVTIKAADMGKAVKAYTEDTVMLSDGTYVYFDTNTFDTDVKLMIFKTPTKDFSNAYKKAEKELLFTSTELMNTTREFIAYTLSYDTIVSDSYPSNANIVIGLPYPESFTNPVYLQNLVMAYYNESMDRWEKIENVTIDVDNGLIKAAVSHLSVYALFVRTYPNLSNVIAYPNPYNPYTAYNGTLKFINLPVGKIKLKIYNFAGELVYETEFESNGVYEWNGRNKYGYLAPEAYIYMLEKDGERKIGKFLMIR